MKYKIINIIKIKYMPWDGGSETRPLAAHQIPPF